jgi:hypothetical protein
MWLIGKAKPLSGLLGTSISVEASTMQRCTAEPQVVDTSDMECFGFFPIGPMSVERSSKPCHVSWSELTFIGERWTIESKRIQQCVRFILIRGRTSPNKQA